MPDGELQFSDGEVSLGGQLLPGILSSQRIGCAVRFDQAQMDGMSGKAKTPLGWADADISLTVELLSDETSDCYAKLTALNRVFKGADNGANPKVYDVANRHARARGISRVVFSGLDSEESDQDDVISATLSFVEHVPAIVKVEKQAASSGTTSAPAATTAQPAADPAVLDDPNPFTAGFEAGAT